MVLRYTNPNAEAFVGEVTVSPAGGYGATGGGGGGVAGEAAGASPGNTVTHKVN